MMLYVIFLGIFSLFIFVSLTLFHEYSYIHSNLLFFAEKALIAIQSGFRLENIGFVYPPVAFIPFIIYNDPLVVPSYMSALISVFFLFYIIREYRADSLSLILSVMLFFNPMYVFLATQRFEVLVFYLLITLSVVYTIKHISEGYSIHIFLAGILLGMTFFVDFRSLFIVPVYVLSIFMSTMKKNISYRLAIVTVKLTPIVFFFLSWIYINWVFTKNPFNFIESPYSFFRSENPPEEFMGATGSLEQSLFITIRQLIIKLPLILPYFVLLFLVEKYRLIYSISVCLVYLLPVFLLYFSIYYGVFFPHMHTSILFLLFAVVFAYHTKRSDSFVLLASMFLSFLFSFLMPFYSKDINERAFVGAIIGIPVEDSLSRKEELQVAEMLKVYNCRSTLSDDAHTFPVVYFTGKTNLFVLPHNYTFYTVLSNPALFVDCLLISRNSGDLLNRRFPKAQQSFVPGFYLLYGGSKYLLYLRQEGFYGTK